MADDALTSEQLAQRLAGADAPAADDALTSEQLTARLVKAAKEGAAKPQQSYLAGLGRTLGGSALMGWGDEALAGLRSLGGETYAEALKDERAKLAHFRKENPKVALAAELGGAFLTPGLGLLTGALKPAASTLGRITQGVGIGSGIGAVAGAGAADEDRIEGAKRGAAFGAAVGPLAPVAGKLVAAGVDKVGDALGPTFARLGMPRALGGSSTAGERAADFVQARELRSQGLTPAQIRARLADVDRSRTFNGGVGATNASEAETPLMLADVSPRLAGSIVRASPEVGARAEAALGARQTGVPSADATAQRFADEAGLTTRNPLSPVPVGATLDAPAGQHERLRGGLQRAYTLADKEHHGFAENAYRTEQDLLKALKTEADRLYGDFRTAQAGYDVRPNIMPAVKTWTDKLADAQVDEGNIIRQGLRAFTSDGKEWVKSVDALDKGKRAIDAKIQAAQQAGNANKVRILKELQSDFVNAGDAITTNDIGKKWAAAREFFSGEKKRQEAIQWGRDALKLDSNASADQFAAFAEDQKKLARLGILESLTTAAGPKKRAADLTQVLETNRALDLLRETIPRTTTPGGKPTGVYGTRPEMFGNYMGNEKGFIKSRDTILGNSATAGRLADDERFTRQTLSTMFDRFKAGNIGVVPLVLEAVSTGLTKFFGFREDVAQELGRRMFTANRAELDRILTRLESQWGVDKLGAFTRFLNAAGTAGAGGIAGPAVRAREENRRPQGLLPAR